ncbi:hypothetical protein, partial [Phenylobacterium sp.]|uniref:hypothetical protein n=1 Tax=Phenylobacterium sp. TaxID=1871053 RepID=UPI0026001A76
MAAPPVRHDACETSGRPLPALVGMGAGWVVLALLAACHRPVPPNVTPPGETAAFSEPSPAASAAPETE